MAGSQWGVDGGGGLATAMGQALRDGGCELPPVGRLPHQAAAVSSRREVRVGRGAEVRPHVFGCGPLAVCAAALQRNALCRAQRGRKAALSQGSMSGEGVIVLDASTGDGDNKHISGHWTGPPVIA